MKKHYVSFEMAKILKEKGYNEPAYCHYDIDGNLMPHLLWNGEFSVEIKHLCHNYMDNVQYAYLAPELHEVQQWLRKEHDMNISVLRVVDGFIVFPKDVNKYFWHRQIPNESVMIDVGVYYDTYELALEAGINEALKMI